MAENTAISWCDATMNPWIGCTKVSPGCDNCYAATQDKFRKWTPEGWGGPRKRTSEVNWGKPLHWNDEPFCECMGCGWRGEAREGEIRAAAGMHPPADMRHCPGCDLPLLKEARRRVFCASLADVFDNEVPIAWRADLFFLIDQTPNLDWLLLTKRIGNAQRMLAETSDYLASVHRPLQLPLPNVWLGATIVNQEEADRDIPKLLATPARVRFLSMEPLLGPVNLWLPTRTWTNSAGGATCDHCCNGDRCDDPTHCERGRPEWRVRCPHCRGTGNGKPINWVIVGGESGAGARPMHPDWARSLRDQCAAAGVPLHFKQWGEFLPASANEADPTVADVPESRLFWSDGSKWDRFDGQRGGVDLVARVGKKAAGRLLDGATHDGFPEVRG